MELVGQTSVKSADNKGTTELQTTGIPGIPLLTALEKTRQIKYSGPQSLDRGQTITGWIKFTRSYDIGFIMILTAPSRCNVSHMATFTKGLKQSWTTARELWRFASRSN